MWFIAQLTVALPRCANASGNAVLDLEGVAWLPCSRALLVASFLSRIRQDFEQPGTSEPQYLGLFIDLIIKISGQKGNFFEIFQIFLYL